MKSIWILIISLFLATPQIAIAEEKTAIIGSHKISFEIDASKYEISTSQKPIESLDGFKGISNTVSIIKKHDGQEIAYVIIKDFDTKEVFTYSGAEAYAYKTLDNPMVTPRKIDDQDGIAAKDDSMMFATYQTKDEFNVAIFSVLPWEDSQKLLDTIHVEEIA